jgi:hypothetical protein
VNQRQPEAGRAPGDRDAQARPGMVRWNCCHNL